MITLEGDHLEGGGQLVRTALALSALTGKSFEVVNIRKGRKEPGLKAQHLCCIEALKKLCNATCEGAELGSTYIKFMPGKIEPKTISVDIGTAGSVSLLLQSLLLPAMLAGGKVRLKIKGGTSGKWAMPYDFLNAVLLPQLRRYADIDAKLVKRGYYPAGGGEIDIKVKGKYTFPLEGAPALNIILQQKLICIKGISHASSDLQKGQVAERQASAAKHVFAKLNVPVKIDTEYADAFSTGSEIVLWAMFSRHEDELDINNPIILGADELGERGKRAEVVGEEAAKKLLHEIESKAPVDAHTADNLVPFIAVFGGEMKVSEITNHIRTNVYVVEQFLGKCIEIDEEKRIIEKTC
ncbi:RNA 3'-terminal phosphate cyclase [archaeon]|nr:RNA 3'-terminal phosphate cyclase [archaeon]